jgi:hypothetical protein
MTSPTRILSDYAAGISVRDLAAWYGVDPDRLREMVPENNPARYSAAEAAAFRINPAGYKYQDERFIDLHEQGLHPAAIARVIGCAKDTVRTRLVRLGIEPNRMRGKRGES